MPTSSFPSDLGLWFERYAPIVRTVAARVTGDPDDADDALQDAFLAAWRFRGRFDGERSPLPWLASIARRKALTIVARRRPLPAGGVTVVAAPSAEDEALRRAADRFAGRLVSAEPALALHALDGLVAREVGERLGVPMRTAASRIARGSRRVAALLQATTHQVPRSKAPWSNSF